MEEFLPRHTVTSLTRARYLKVTHDFFYAAGLAATSPRAEFDSRLSQHLLTLFLDGEQVAAARYAVYGLRWYLNLELNELPLSVQAVMGFRSLAHENSRDPNVLEAVLAASVKGMNSLDLNRQIAAIAAVVQFDLVCRPSEVLKITPEWITKGPPGRGGAQALVCFFPSSAEATDKCRQQGDTVVAGEATQYDWISPLLLRLKKKVAPGNPVFPLTLAQYEAAFKANAVETKLPRAASMTPHRNRHGGASLMHINGSSTTDIMTRGRWSSLSSVMRYKKHGRYLRLLETLPDRVTVEASSTQRVLG